MVDLLTWLLPSKEQLKTNSKKIAGGAGMSGLGLIIWWVQSEISEVKADVNTKHQGVTSQIEEVNKDQKTIIGALSSIQTAIENQTSATNRIRDKFEKLDDKLDRVKEDVEVLKRTYMFRQPGLSWRPRDSEHPPN